MKQSNLFENDDAEPSPHYRPNPKFQRMTMVDLWHEMGEIYRRMVAAQTAYQEEKAKNEPAHKTPSL